MIRVERFDTLAAPLNRLLLSGCQTNGLPERQTLEALAAAGRLYAAQPESGGLLLLEAEADFDRLRYCLPAGATLVGWTPRRTTVAELACRPGRPADFPAGAGWTPILQRVRLTRNAQPLPPETDGATSPALPDVQEAEQILCRCFSALTGCLPTQESLRAACAEGRLLCHDGGVLDWAQKGNQTELRHLAVLPEHRRQGVAASLLSEYLRRCGDRVSRVWTGEDNHAARDLYRKFGYAEDGWTSTVWLWRDEATETTRTEA